MAIEGTAASAADVAKNLLAEWDAGWVARDPDALADVFTEDGSWEDPSLIRPIQGRPELRGYFAAMMRAIPDIEVRQEEVLLNADDDSRMGSRWVIRGTFSENLESPQHMGFPLVATGDRVEFTGVALAILREGRVERIRQYVDMVSFQRQIGMLPPVGSRGERFLGRLQAFGARRRRKRNAR